MAVEGEIYLGPTGSEELISGYANEVQRSFVEIGRSDTTADGSLKTDIISRKYRFVIPNNVVNQTVLDLLYTQYELDQEMNLRIYITDVSWFTNFDGNVPVVKMMPFPSTDFITGKTTKIYKDVPLTFQEV